MRVSDLSSVLADDRESLKIELLPGDQVNRMVAIILMREIHGHRSVHDVLHYQSGEPHPRTSIPRQEQDRNSVRALESRSLQRNLAMNSANVGTLSRAPPDDLCKPDGGRSFNRRSRSQSGRRILMLQEYDRVLPWPTPVRYGHLFSKSSLQLCALRFLFNAAAPFRRSEVH